MSTMTPSLSRRDFPTMIGGAIAAATVAGIVPPTSKQLRAQIARLQAQIVRLHAQIVKLQGELEVNDAEVERLQAEIANYVTLVAALEARINELEAAAEPPKPIFKGTRDLFAVRVFPHYVTRNYGNHPAVHEWLDRLGVARISGQINPAMTPAVMDFYRDRVNRGDKLWLTVGIPHVPLTSTDWDQLAGHVDALGDGIELLSGWNEPNHARSPKVLPNDWVAQTNAHQTELFTRFGGQYQIGTPQLWSGDIDQQYRDLACLDLAGKYHVITWHLYMRPQLAASVIDEAMLVRQETEFRRILGDQTNRIVCTESGFFTPPSYTGGSNPVTEEQQAALLPELVDWYTSRGYGYTYFELLDEPDPSGADREDWFGLVRCPSNDPTTWTSKPAADIVARMLTRDR